jgi:hypothetical protein
MYKPQLKSVRPKVALLPLTPLKAKAAEVYTTIPEAEVFGQKSGTSSPQHPHVFKQLLTKKPLHSESGLNTFVSLQKSSLSAQPGVGGEGGEGGEGGGGLGPGPGEGPTLQFVPSS